MHEQLDHLTKEYHTKLFQLTQKYMALRKDMNLSKDQCNKGAILIILRKNT